MRRFLLLILIFTVVYPRKHCVPAKKFLRYSKIKSCYRSTLPLISLTNVNKVEECMRFARRKNGLAFNFSPREAQQHVEGSVVNCQVLSCTEVKNSFTLVPDLSFDYYSAYGNRVLTVVNEKLNYKNAINNCQKMGADLADVSSEIRTRHLSKAINNSLLDWYKVAYIGLDDIDQEGSFMTVSGSPLTCSPFRAWAPGHPRSSRVNEDCVVLDTDKMWRVVDCKSRLPSLCEFYPNKPEKANDLFGVSCTGTHDKKKRKKCEAQQSLFELFKNASRKEKCYITNYEDNLTLSYP